MKALRDEAKALRDEKAAKKAAFDAEYDVGEQQSHALLRFGRCIMSHCGLPHGVTGMSKVPHAYLRYGGLVPQCLTSECVRLHRWGSWGQGRAVQEGQGSGSRG